jgi:hypothetical protein
VKFYIFLIISIVFLNSIAFAWEKRGHEIIASVAARILEEKRNKPFLRHNEFDLGYYANVPDIIWRSDPPPASHMEPPQHYIDWNKTLEGIFGAPKNLPVDFYDYKSKMGDKFNLKLGVAPFRIHDFVKRCHKMAQNLSSQETQGKLLECLGELSHYTGDLSMPLHVSENYNGEMTGQKGVHGFFEGVLVDALDPQLKVDIEKTALESFEKSEMRKMTSDAVTRWMISDSLSHVDELLKIDKETDRKNISQAKDRFRALITQRLVQGAIYTAIVWNEILADVFHFNEDHFYFFEGEPEYVVPGKEI